MEGATGFNFERHSMSIIDSLKSAQAISRNNRASAHTIIDEKFDAIDVELQTAISELETFFQETHSPTPPDQPVVITPN